MWAGVGGRGGFGRRHRRAHKSRKQVSAVSGFYRPLHPHPHHQNAAPASA